MACILLVDDEELVRKMLCRALSQAGHQVVEAGNGAQGLEAYEQNSIDLVITDIVMPESEGLGMIMQLRRRNPQVKIIAISGGGRINPQGYLESAEVLGASRSFCKPVALRELLGAVDELLAESPAGE